MRILRNVSAWTAVGGLVVALGCAAWGQSTGLSNPAGSLQTPGSGGGRGSQSPNSPITAPPSPTDTDTSISPQTEDSQAKLRNVERQKQLVEDTQKLLSLANELKTDVDKSTKDTLSLDVIRKADEIEKLARTVKEKMRGT